MMNRTIKSKSFQNSILKSFFFVTMTVALVSCLSVTETDESEDSSSSGGGSTPVVLKLISASATRSAAVSLDGRLKTWGTNDWSELGYEDATIRGDDAGEMGTNLAYVNLGTGRTVKAISSGDYHTCVILDNNKVKCWGWNGEGELGYEDTLDRGGASGTMGDNLPYVNLGTGRTAKSISVGGSHACAILDNNTLKCWGYNQDGELGLGDLNWRGDAPNEMGDDLPVVNLGTGRTAKMVSCSGHHTCALLDNNTVKCWGHNSMGQLGQEDTDQRGHGTGLMGDALLPINLGTGRTAKYISSGGFYSCAILDNDTVKCWGQNNAGQLGLGDTVDRGHSPGEMGDNLPTVDLGTGLTAKTIHSFSNTTCVILSNNKVKCWGANNAGQLGIGDANNRGDDANEMGDNLPYAELGTGLTAVSLSVGASHNCALLSDTSIKCWGAGWRGPLGTENNNDIGRSANEMGDNLPVVDLGF